MTGYANSYELHGSSWHFYLLSTTSYDLLAVAVTYVKMLASCARFTWQGRVKHIECRIRNKQFKNKPILPCGTPRKEELPAKKSRFGLWTFHLVYQFE